MTIKPQEWPQELREAAWERSQKATPGADAPNAQFRCGCMYIYLEPVPAKAAGAEEVDG